MSELVAVTSISQLQYGHFLDRLDVTPMLKRAAILCDHVYVDTTGLGPAGGAIERRVINHWFGGEAESLDLLSDKRFRALVLRPEDFGESGKDMLEVPIFDNDGALYGDAVSEYLARLPEEELLPFAKPWRGVDYKTYGAAWSELVADLNRPLTLRPWIDEPIGLLAPTHREILSRAIASNTTPIDMFQELAVEARFDFGVLPWNDILKLRRSARIDDFRRALKKLESAPPGDIRTLWRAEVESLAETTMVSPARSLIGGFLGNLPLGNVSPFGVAGSVVDYFRDDERERRYGWLYFVMSARKQARRRAGDDQSPMEPH